MTNSHRFPVIRCLIFFAVLAVVIVGLQSVFIIDEQRGYDHVTAFYQEKPNTLDAIFVGASEVHATWQPVIGWGDYGYAVWNYSIDAMPPKAVKLIIEEARKRQPQAVFLISLNPFKIDTDSSGIEKIHRAVDFLPLSKTKMDLVNTLTGEDYSLSEKMEFLFPIIRFHSRWDSLKPTALGEKPVDYKGAMRTETYRKKVYDVAGTYHVYNGESDVPEEIETVVEDLLDYLDRNQIQATFVKFPQDLEDDQLGRMNQIERTVAEHGYPVLDLLKQAEELNIDFHSDFYNKRHLNVHGSLKAIHAIGQYLTAQYSFADKRESAGWESWDTASEKYMSFIRPYVLPFETSHEPRAGLAAPKLKKPAVKGQSITLSWNASEGADGYKIYRSTGKSWEYAGEVDYSMLQYEDSGLKPSRTYSYTVVPFQYDEETGVRYGYFDIKGVSGKTGEGKK